MNSDDESDLRATSESIADDAARLAAIEAKKATLSIDDPRLVGLSTEAEEVVRDIVPKVAAESAIVEGVDERR
jgi:hypothetical protein